MSIGHCALSIASASLFLLATSAPAQRSAPLVLSHLTWLDRSGTTLGRIGPLADHGNIELSPDGSKIAVAVSDRARGTRDIWIYQTSDGRRTQFTSDAADENWLIWSPDGTRVAVNSFSPAGVDLFEMPAAGTASRTPLIANADGIWPVSWSPDGRFILYVTNSRSTSNDILVLPLTGDKKPYAFRQTEASENWAAFSPDGRWVAFSSTEPSGRAEVYVARFASPGRTWRVSADGGSQARWRKDGKEIFYLAPDRRLMAAAITSTGDSFDVTRVDPLFTISYPYGAYHAFDVSKDGERFLVNALTVGAGAPALRASR